MKTQQQKVDEANLAGQKASEITGVPFTAGTIETYFPQPEKKTEPLPTTPSPYYPRYTEQEQQATDILSQPMDTESTEEIQARKMKQAQGQIDALNKLYSTKLAEQRDINVGQERRTASVSTLTGLAGSSEAGVQARKTEVLGEKQMGAIQQEQAVMIQSILSDVSKSAVEEARYQSEESRKSAREILDLRTQRQEKVIRDLSIMGQTGATIEGLRAEMPAEDFDYLVRNAGGEEMLKRNLSLNRPVESIVSEITSGGSHFITWQNPITGDIRTDEIPLNIPTEYTEKADLGDQLMFFPKGSPQEAIFINKTSSPKDIADIEYKKAQTAKLWGEMTGADVEADADVSDLTKGILANIASIKDLTPSGREEVIAEIYRSGRGGELSNKMDEYAVNKANSVIPAVDLALDQLEETGTGFVGFGASKIPGTDAFRLLSTIDTIFANIAFGELTAMRASSPTGGALGQVSERELALLGSVQASLKMGIGNELMKANLNKVKKIFVDIKERASKTEDLSSMVQQAGYDYEAMKADGLSDEEIKQAIQ